MKKLMVIVLASWALVMSQGFRQVAAHQGYTPLAELAGTYAATFQGSFAVCLGNASQAPVPCGSPDSTVIRLTALGVGGATFDAAGNFCIPFTETNTTVPVDASPTELVQFNNVGKITSYDPRTGTGEKSETNYVGGQCHGARFDSTGATAVGTGSSHFAVSNDGKRIDGVVAPSTDPTIGGYSFSFTFLRQ